MPLNKETNSRYLKPFKFVQTNDWYWIELFVLEIFTIIKPFVNIIISCRQHGYPRLSLATSPYRSSPLASLQGYIPYPHIAAECMFELVVLLLPGHMWGSIGVHHLWARPCFLAVSCMSGSSNLDCFRDGRPYSWCLVGCCRQDLFNITRSIFV